MPRHITRFGKTQWMIASKAILKFETLQFLQNRNTDAIYMISPDHSYLRHDRTEP